ncbi:MAG: enoyl-CoA hydratase [Solirubrobacterales bacterium]|nr:enoyl-CoA hydratase [Solirubrobacterales bacterium]
MPGEVLVDEPADGVVRLTISHPEKRNALDHAILDRLAELLTTLRAPCVILTGTQGMFSSGYDIGEIPDDVFAVEAERLVAHPFTAAISALEAYPYATVAAISGHAIGGGLELALSCDLRVVHDGVKLGMPPAKLGLIYSHTGLRKFLDAIGALEAYPYATVAAISGHAIGGGLELALSCDLRVVHDGVKLGMPPAKLGLIYSHTGLRKFLDAIGEPRTRELFLLGRNVDAATALDWGLVNRVAAEDELAGVALELARELAGNAPLSIAGNKRVLRELLTAAGELDADVETELLALRKACFASDDLREGVRAFADKRTPRWSGR